MDEMPDEETGKPTYIIRNLEEIYALFA